MGLDIQPLSPARQALSLVVLLALLGASLGFAAYLVKQRQVAVPVYRISVVSPKGMTTPVRGWEGIEGVVMTGEGTVAGKPRRFGVFSYESDIAGTEQSLLGEGRKLLGKVTGGVTEFSRMYAQEATVGSAGRLPAVQLGAAFGKGDEAEFVVLRVAVVPTGGRVVAICYSGAGGVTDADGEIFEDFCANGVVIRRVNPKAK